MKTFNDCCQEVAEKYGLGTTLVTGHLAKYWKEAAEMYAEEKVKESLKFVKNIDEVFRKEKGV